jgi:hypothetical protein
MDSVSVTIVEEVAQKEGVPSEAVTPPLNNVINTDALDRLFEPRLDADTRTQGRVEFPYVGYQITVLADGTVRVR